MYNVSNRKFFLIVLASVAVLYILINAFNTINKKNYFNVHIEEEDTGISSNSDQLNIAKQETAVYDTSLESHSEHGSGAQIQAKNIDIQYNVNNNNTHELIDNIIPEKIKFNKIIKKESDRIENSSDLSLNEEIATYNVIFDDDMQMIKEEICTSCPNEICNKACFKFDKIIDFFKKGEIQEMEGMLKVLPMDPLAWSLENENDHEKLESFIENLIKTTSYLTFSGANYILLCITMGCKELMKKISMEMANEKGTRAIWAGLSEYDKDESEDWSCPIRIIKIEENEIEMNNLEAILNDVMRKSSVLIKGRELWSCTYKGKGPYYWDEIDIKKRKIGGIKINKYKFVFCAIAKNGSTMTKMFLRRITDKRNWRGIGNGIIHNPSRNGLKSINSNKTEGKEIFEDPFWVKAVIVREPAARLLSAYLSKVVHENSNRIVPSKWKKNHKRRPTFKEFVNVVTSLKRNQYLDEHLRPQIQFCGLKSNRFDFVGKLERMRFDFVNFTKSVGINDKYVNSGWGDDHQGSFVDSHAYRYNPHHSENKIWKYYNTEMLVKVYEFYKDDADRFGYSLDELLKDKPSTF